MYTEFFSVYTNPVVYLFSLLMSYMYTSSLFPFPNVSPIILGLLKCWFPGSGLLQMIDYLEHEVRNTSCYL